jgi:hypothetical protein
MKDGSLKKNYTIHSHALHSRLQLIRSKLDINPSMTSEQFLMRNRKYFIKAAESIETYHNFKCGDFEYNQAAELFITAFNADEKKIWDLPIWKPKGNDSYGQE